MRKICPECFSLKVVKSGKIPTSRGKIQRYQCENGHTFYDTSDYAPRTIKRSKRFL